MIGDKLVITDYHRDAAARVLDALTPRLAAASGANENGASRRTLPAASGALAVSIAGESGCGKTETAHCLAEALEARGHACLILSQDDYFKLPPKSNHRRRLEDIDWVGTGEVRLDLLAEHVAALKAHPDQPLEKPLSFYEEDEIKQETVPPGPRDVVIVEGTYTTLLPDIDLRVFIDRTYHETKKARLARARDPDVGFLEKVLEIEHREISRHKARADLVIPPP